MKVYELDEAYTITKAEAKAALELAGLSTHHASKLDEDELAQFEAALEIAEDEADDADGELPEWRVIDEPQELEAVEVENKYFDGDSENWYAKENDPLVMGLSYLENNEPKDVPNIKIAPPKRVKMTNRSENLDKLLSIAEGAIEQTPPQDIFPVVNMGGAFEENLVLEPGLSARFRKVLADRKICDYTLNVDRGELIAITWPDMQKLRVPIDE